MPWGLISELLGPGLLWSHSQEKILEAIAEAERLGRLDAVEHLKGMLKLRNKVMFEKPIDKV